MTIDDEGIAPYTYRDGTPYFIHWERIQDADELQGWLNHLRLKPWWTERMDRWFIESVMERLGIAVCVAV